MALIFSSISSPSLPPSADLKLPRIPSPAPAFPSSSPRPFLAPPPLFVSLRTQALHLTNFRRTKRHVVRMAPEEEKLTRRSPLDFPIEWERPRPGRRPDIFPQFSPMKTPLPPPMPSDPDEIDEEEEEEKQKKEQEEGGEEGEGDDDDDEEEKKKPDIGG